jgi:hypothetical protein
VAKSNTSFSRGANRQHSRRIRGGCRTIWTRSGLPESAGVRRAVRLTRVRTRAGSGPCRASPGVQPGSRGTSPFSVLPVHGIATMGANPLVSRVLYAPVITHPLPVKETFGATLERRLNGYRERDQDARSRNSCIGRFGLPSSAVLRIRARGWWNSNRGLASRKHQIRPQTFGKPSPRNFDRGTVSARPRTTLMPGAVDVVHGSVPCPPAGDGSPRYTMAKLA